MRGWIIYKDSQGLLKQETYGERLLAAKKGYRFTSFRQINLI